MRYLCLKKNLVEYLKSQNQPDSYKDNLFALATGYYGSISAIDFGRMMPAITVQKMPFYLDIADSRYGSNGANIE
ncbi:hypothetical protein, partial [Sphingobacterium micropteri]|uniref:hypothetical protein n=1 Tax=Sphingobacterium micropteri TaxID=2763501 RepID=UPI001CC322F2